MLALLKKRAVLVTLGLLLLALFVWYAGPYFAFAELHPWAPVWMRLLTIVLIVAAYCGTAVLKKIQAWRSNQQLSAAVAQPQPGSDDAQQLQQRFAEAVAVLQAQRSELSLYALPWYVMIGAPGSGKTTALMNSGLNFPLAQQFGKEALRGVAGTRHCDWWFTDQAILLDTAGRYTTQDSDQQADQMGWQTFLKLLCQYRKRRPINGVLVALSATDLLTHSAAQQTQHIAIVRQRLEELTRTLNIQLPVYVLVTKCDLVAGFSEYFDDLDQGARAQVWGVTFPHTLTAAQAAGALSTEFDALISRLNERMLARVQAERDVRRRAAIFAFPQQMAALRETLTHFVSAVFQSKQFHDRILLRGTYFTSGTQAGTPMDRLLGAMGRQFALQPAAISGGMGRGKAYFVQRLLQEVVFAESGLAGVNRRYEVRKAAAQTAAYAALLALTVLGISAFALSYSRNKTYLTSVTAVVKDFNRLPTVSGLASLEQLLPRLDALLAVVNTAEQYRHARPWSMRFGLYQGNHIGGMARAAYVRELNTALLPYVMSALRAQVVANAAYPDRLYEYLKAYLMLVYPEHLDKTQLAFITDLEWQRIFAAAPTVRTAVTQHFQNLLANQASVRPMVADTQLVAQARTAIQQASVARLLFSRLKLRYASDTERAVHLDRVLGLGAAEVLARQDGKSLAEPISALYTPAVFKEISGLGTAELAQQINADSWVLGETAAATTPTPQIINELLNTYEQAYIQAWDEVLAQVQIKSFQGLAETVHALGILSAPSSPLKALFNTVVANTQLIQSADPNAGVMGKAQQALQNTLGRILTAGQQSNTETPPGSAVTAHFSALQQMLVAPPDSPPGQAPFERVLTQLAQVQQQLSAVGSGIGDTNPLEALKRSGSGAGLKTLQQEAALLPPAVQALVTQVTGGSESVAVGQARSELVNLYETQVARECRAIIRGRYPFSAGSTRDVPLADFARLFASDGIFDHFFKENLTALVDTSRTTWAWRSGVSASLGLSDDMLRQFEQAQRIRERFFPLSGAMPAVQLNLTPIYLDAGVNRLTVEIDGQSVEYRHGPERATSVTWPGPSPGVAAVSFTERTGGGPHVDFRGPWAWFRLLDAAKLEAKSDVRYVATWKIAGHETRVMLEASSIRNPFAGTALRRFRCGS